MAFLVLLSLLPQQTLKERKLPVPQSPAMGKSYIRLTETTDVIKLIGGNLCDPRPRRSTKFSHRYALHSTFQTDFNA